MTDVIKTRLKNICCTLAFPVTVLVIMEILCRIKMGRHVFNTLLDIQNYVRSVGISACTALALSYNLGHGRFDLSLGAQRMLVAIIGGNIAIKLGLGAPGIILFSLAFGFIAGSLVGMLFVVTRIPAMVLGVGMGLVYECIAFALSKSQGLQLYGLKGVSNLSNMYLTICVVIAAVLIVMILERYTKFGFYTRAINGSQRIAHNSGINIFAHAVGCYAIAGGLVSFSGVFDAAFKGRMDAELGFGSNASVMTNCFPMFLGKFMSRWSSTSVGILFSTMTIKIFETGLSVIKVSATGQQVYTMSLFLALLIFLANENVFKNSSAKKERIAEAAVKKAKLALV
ncbi:inner-membrane translocator [Spirochaetia bacterium]|nr:inner-membrane translocator [Spirochaetia bacterium]